MTINREQIMTALFGLVSSPSLFVTKSRKLRVWEEVPQEERPAIFQHEGNEDTHEGSSGLPIATLEVNLFIYVWSKFDEVPATNLNNVMAEVERVLMPSSVPDLLSQQQTLGGLVNSVYKDGRTIKITGDLDGDGIAIVPLKIIVPA